MSIADDLASSLDSLFGENAKEADIRTYLDTGLPELNKILSGYYDQGAAVGRMIEIFGPASSGKTFISTMLMAAAQKQGGIAGFSDHERSFKLDFAKTLGLNDHSSKFRYIRPKTFEESVDMAVQFCEIVRKKKLIPPEAPLVWVFDSVPAMIPHSVLYDDKGERRKVGTHNMRDKLMLAQSTSQYYPLLAQWAEDYNMTVILLNQIRLDPGVMFGNPEKTPGGKAAEFYASIRLSLGKKNIVEKNGKEKTHIGFQITAETVKNKLTRPFQKAVWQVTFNDTHGVSIDAVASNVDFMVRKGFIAKVGNYLEFEGKKLYQSKLIENLRSDPDALKRLMDMLPDDHGAIGDDIEDTMVATELETRAEIKPRKPV